MAKQSYDTVRDMERANSGWFKVAGIIGLVGLVLFFVGFASSYILILGIAALVAAAVMFFVAMLRVIHLSKAPVRHIYCPYCASKNDVFMSKTELPCDICGRKIGISPIGEAYPLEPVEEEDD